MPGGQGISIRSTPFSGLRKWWMWVGREFCRPFVHFIKIVQRFGKNVYPSLCYRGGSAHGHPVPPPTTTNRPPQTMKSEERAADKFYLLETGIINSGHPSSFSGTDCLLAMNHADPQGLTSGRKEWPRLRPRRRRIKNTSQHRNVHKIQLCVHFHCVDFVR